MTRLDGLPGRQAGRPRVYLAGKIATHDWRHGLFDVSQSANQEYRYDRKRDLIQVVGRASNVRDGFEYAGPYFLSDDHGCFHGETQHGLINPGYADGPGDVDVGWPATLSRRTVMHSCLSWLGATDVVFCWLESFDAYGTLVELGYAHARGIPIYLAFDPEIQRRHEAEIEHHNRTARSHEMLPISEVGANPWLELWFAREIASACSTDLDVHEAWVAFGDWWGYRMQGYWALRQRQLEEGGPWCPTHRRSSSSWR